MKYHTGDVVMARKHWGTVPEKAVVMGCYRDICNGKNENDYSLEFADDRQSWFQASQLELVEAAETGEGMRLLKAWRAVKYAKQDAEDAVYGHKLPRELGLP